MTQLVQLQQSLPVLRDAGYEVFAVSNDTVERLSEFADRHDITFALLSDEDSAVIRAFGILNTLIRPDEGVHMRWYGIPYPGTYITGATGVVVDKDFHQHHARRLSGSALVHRVLGTIPEPGADAPVGSTSATTVVVDAYLADDALRLEVISTLVCRMRIADGLHLYAEGAPEAFTAVVVGFEGDGVRFGEQAWPEPTTLEMPLLDLSVPVWDGEVVMTIPITATSELVRLGHGLGQTEVEVRVSCRYQACDELSCGLPETVELALSLPLETLVEPDGVQVYVARVEQEARAEPRSQ